MRSWHDDWPAPAKLNLFLHVVGQRADGYHPLQTVFRFLDFGDTLNFVPRPDGRIILRTPLPGVPADQDLTVRAAQRLQQATETRHGRRRKVVLHATQATQAHALFSNRFATGFASR